MANKFAIGAGGNWNDDTTWSTTSGGSNDTVKPTAADDVFLDSNSGNVTINGASVARSLNCTGYTGTLTHNSSSALTLGDATAGANNIILKLVAGMTYSLGSATTSSISFSSSSSTQQTIDTGGKTLGNVNLPNTVSTPSLLLSSNLTCGAIGQNGGTFNTGGYTVTATSWTQSGGNARTVTITDSTVNLTGTSGTVWNATNATLNASGSIIVINSISSSTRTFAGSGLTYDTLTYTLAGSTGQLNITGSNTFSVINFSDTDNARTLAFTAGNTTTFTGNGIVGNGSSGKVLVLTSITAAGHTLSKTSGTVSINWWNISRSTAEGGASWYAGANSTDGGNNSGWVFSAPPVASSNDGKGGGSVQSLMNLQNLRNL